MPVAIKASKIGYKQTPNVPNKKSCTGLTNVVTEKKNKQKDTTKTPIPHLALVESPFLCLIKLSLLYFGKIKTPILF